MECLIGVQSAYVLWHREACGMGVKSKVTLSVRISCAKLETSGSHLCLWFGRAGSCLLSHGIWVSGRQMVVEIDTTKITTEGGGYIGTMYRSTLLLDMFYPHISKLTLILHIPGRHFH